MDIRRWSRNGILLGAGIGLALFADLESSRVTAASPPTEGSQAVAGPNVVLTGSYSCNYTVTSYSVGPIGDPDPTIETYAETSDSLSFSTTGGNVPVGQTGPDKSIIGPGSPIGIGPGGRLGPATPISGFGTGHSFTDGSIEDCVRFAQTMSAAVRGLGCATSDVRRRQPPQTLGYYLPSASFSFVCEGPQADIVHGMGELSRAVLALKLQPPN